MTRVASPIGAFERSEPASAENPTADPDLDRWQAVPLRRRAPLVVRRTRILGPQAELFPNWRHHAFITDRTGTTVDLDADHRAHAQVELAIRDLKDGAGLTHCPSGRFHANGAWAVLASVAHNLLRWVHLIGTGTTGPVVAKTLRRRLLILPGRVAQGGRQQQLHLPTRWPWATELQTTLARLRTIPLRC